MSRSVIEQDLTIDGNVASPNGDIEVKGRVTGDISSRSVNVHAGGKVDGAINATEVMVQGTLSGRIECASLALEKDAEVRADVKAQTLSSEKGARLVGKVDITG